MIIYLLKDIICRTFEKECGRHQANNNNPKAFIVAFNIHSDYEKEEGYRHVELLIYAPFNYVSVAYREHWNVVSFNNSNKEYVKGSSEWKKLAYHDSCWRDDGVYRFLEKYEGKLSTFYSNFSFEDEWWKLIDPPEEIIKLFRF